MYKLSCSLYASSQPFVHGQGCHGSLPRILWEYARRTGAAVSYHLLRTASGHDSHRGVERGGGSISSPCTRAVCPRCPATTLVLEVPDAASALYGKTNIPFSGTLQGPQTWDILRNDWCGQVLRDLVLQPRRHSLPLFTPCRGMTIQSQI